MTIRALLEDSGTEALRRVCDYAALRHRALSHNLANADTPGFKRFDLVFTLACERRRQATLLTTHAQHIARMDDERVVGFPLVREVATTLREDGNNVDPEVESVRLAQNALLFETSARVLIKRIQALRAVITEGRQTP